MQQPRDDDWSARHSVAANAQRTAALVNVLAADDPGGLRAAAGPAEGADADADADAGADAGAAADAAARADTRADTRTATAVGAVLREYGEADPVDLTPDDLAGLRAAARSLREVFAADRADLAAARLNRLLASGTGMLRLTSHGGTGPWHPHVDSDDEAPWAEWFLASSCVALAVLLWDRQRPPGGLCASPSCLKVYVAQARGPNRRYCSRRCATRERVAAHRRARAAPVEPSRERAGRDRPRAAP